MIALIAAISGLTSAGSAAAADVCTPLEAPMTAVEIGAIRQEILRVMPVRYAKAARDVEIVSVATSLQNFAPSVRSVGGGRFQISVPVLFRSLQCRLLVLDVAQRFGFLKPEDLKKAVDGCISRWAPPACIDIVSAAFVERDWAAGTPRSAEMAGPLFKMTDSAIVGLLLHEYAHIVLGHFTKPGERVEIEADAFAFTYSMLGGVSAEPVLSTFAGLTFADSYFPEGLHGSFACRASIANRSITRLSAKIWSLNFWPFRTSAEYLADRAERTNPPPSAMPAYVDPPSLRCRGGDSAVLPRIERDVDTILALLDRLAAPANASSDPFAFYAPLRDLHMTTDEGRYARAWLLAGRLSGYAETFGADHKFASRFLAVLNGVVRGSETDFFPSEPFGWLLSTRAALQFSVDAAGGSPRAHINDLRGELSRALYYAPRYFPAYQTLIGIELAALDCPAARRAFDRGASVFGEPWAQRFGGITQIMDVEMKGRPCADVAAAITRRGLLSGLAH